MIGSLDDHRERIASAIHSIVDDAAVHLDLVGSWGSDLRSRLTDFATRGKLMRGSLVAVGSEVFESPPDDDLYRIAAAVELIQSFLLIHDDIMDEDHTRRGTPSVFEQYRQLGVDGDFSNPRRFGESMGICSGDVALLLAFEAVACSSFTAELRVELVRRIASEIADVGVAQMADVANGHRPNETTEDEILSVYRWKTGRYTFSLPLSLGARIAGASPEQTDRLALWGELQGIIFQIRDDEIGLMEDETGKPSGSDVAADKQTLHRMKLFAALPGSDWENVRTYFGSPLTRKHLQDVREALVELGVLKEISKVIDRLDQESNALLDQMGGLTSDARAGLEEIAAFNRGRRQ